jgi:hypothetical protein
VTGDPNQRASVSVHVRVTNGSGRVVRPEAPVLHVGKTVVKIAPNASAKAAAPLLAALAKGAVADGRLRFDTSGAVSGQLTAPRLVRIQIVGKTINVTPRIGSAISG